MDATELLEEIQAQDLENYEECFETLLIAYREYLDDKSNKELKELYHDAVEDMKFLITD